MVPKRRGYNEHDRVKKQIFAVREGCTMLLIIVIVLLLVLFLGGGGYYRSRRG
jgi:hypothetical protein